MSERSINLSRHMDLIPETLYTQPIHVIGVGGVGGFVVEQIGRMQIGNALHLYDGDEVSDTNPTSQVYFEHQIGQSKVEALAQLVHLWSGENIVTVNHNYMVAMPVVLSGYVFLCLDSMEARRQIMEQSIFGNPNIKMVIETRMDVRFVATYVIDPNNPDHQARWLDEWYPDSEGESLARCDGIYSIPTACMSNAAQAVQLLLNHCSQERPSPNCTQYHLWDQTLIVDYW